MAEQKPGGLFSSLKYTNILLTIITIILILSVVCIHMNKKRYHRKYKKGAISGITKLKCPICAPEAPTTK